MSSKRQHGEMPSNGASFEKLDCKSNCNSHQTEDAGAEQTSENDTRASRTAGSHA